MGSGPQPQKASASVIDLHDAIRRRAEEIYARSGKLPGRDLENWCQAETEILRESTPVARNRYVVIRANGVEYIGRYDCSLCGDYKAGEFSAGASVTIRLDGDKMFVCRHNGEELETTLVKRIHD